MRFAYPISPSEQREAAGITVAASQAQFNFQKDFTKLTGAYSE
jgi:hypothetical protein